MWNDIELQCLLLDVFNDEKRAFKWLFTPLNSLGRTPMEIIACGEKEAILLILETQKNKEI